MAEDITEAVKKMFAGLDDLLAKAATENEKSEAEEQASDVENETAEELRRIELLFKNFGLMSELMFQAEEAAAFFGEKINIDVGAVSLEFLKVSSIDFHERPTAQMLSIGDRFAEEIDELCGDEPIVIIAASYSVHQGEKQLHLSIKKGMVDNITIAPKTILDWDEAINSSVELLPVIVRRPEIEIKLLPVVQDRLGNWCRDYTGDAVHVPISKILGIYRLQQTNTDEPKV